MRRYLTLITLLVVSLSPRQRELVVKYRATAERFVNTHWRWWDEACGYAMEILTRAAITFRSDKGVPFRAYLTNKLRFGLVDAYRKYTGHRKSHKPRPLEAVRFPDPDERIVEQDEAARLLDGLPPEAIKMATLIAEGKDRTEVGRELGIGPTGVTERLKVVRATLERKLRKAS